MPLALSDHQLDAVLRAAQPLPVGDRAAFLEALAQAWLTTGRSVTGSSTW
jgi:hypothetical protein